MLGRFIMSHSALHDVGECSMMTLQAVGDLRRRGKHVCRRRTWASMNAHRPPKGQRESHLMCHFLCMAVCLWSKNASRAPGGLRRAPIPSKIWGLDFLALSAGYLMAQMAPSPCFPAEQSDPLRPDASSSARLQRSPVRPAHGCGRVSAPLR
jgi:hypothetical protein